MSYTTTIIYDYYTTTSAGTGEYFPPLQFPCRNCGGGDRGGVAIYRPFGEFRRPKIALSPVWCSRPTTGVPLAHATMNFVGLDLTTSDRYRRRIHKRIQVVPEKEIQAKKKTVDLGI
ncbi:hypothetical protein TNCV_2101661 [Trichonephila clavipes]|nr:hypothetical protein TNCV_2101661 [Trichonephila clavipes]